MIGCFHEVWGNSCIGCNINYDLVYNNQILQSLQTIKAIKI